MTTPIERWLLDTNIWLFGLRRDQQFQACGELLYLVGAFSVVIPLQILKELNANFTEEEAKVFHRLVNDYPEFVELNWQRAPVGRTNTSKTAAVVKAMRSLPLTPKLAK